MSKMNKAPVCYPPQFPLEGRLSHSAGQIQHNLRRQDEWERNHHDALCLEAGRRLPRACCKTLHISLFFDGTGNNLNNDLYESAVAHPTNIARLFRATIGAGHAGGVAHRARSGGLTDASGIGNGQFYKYYMPGVGTPFPEVGDLDYSSDGLAFARRGEERINWALLMIIDALRRALGMTRQDDSSLQAAVEGMGTWMGTEWVMGRVNRSRVFRRELKALEVPLRRALESSSSAMPRLLGVKLYVYGFSRGAAAARAFVNWLNQMLTPKDSSLTLSISDLKLPVSVEYLGLLDTVVSVGIADIAPGSNGHMGWGDGSQEIPKGALVKRCLHIVASHEQRLSFPLESIRREDGTYPSNSQEVIYPGVHSDQGGGYPPGDQGKAIGNNDSFLLSQIALNDIYADALLHGAPFKISEGAGAQRLGIDNWRAMDRDLIWQFAVSPLLIDRFNAWREVTLQASAEPQVITGSTKHYEPRKSASYLEDALRVQMDWLTAWRIDRYGFCSLVDSAFFRMATDEHDTAESSAKAKEERDQKQANIERRRELQLDYERRGAPKKLLEPGVKNFDPSRSKTQLREAAEEFGRIYRDLNSDPYLTFFRRARWRYGPAIIIYWKSADKMAEHQRMKAGGQAKVSQLFPPPLHQRNHLSEDHRGNVDEDHNREEPEGLLRMLFDDHVHDSRAWFLHALLNDTYMSTSVAAGREPWGSYFTERMVFFGETNRRDVAVVPDINGPSTIATATENIPLTDAERKVRAAQEIATLWGKHYAEVGRDDTQA